MAGHIKTLIFLSIIGILAFIIFQSNSLTQIVNHSNSLNISSEQKEGSGNSEPHPMNIETLRARNYPGSEFTVKQTLSNDLNYRQFIVSYLSEGLEINGLLTIPTTPKPAEGFPAVVFVHGYIPPEQWSTTGSYPTYPSYLARNGFVVFKPDLRGHGQSEGEPVSAHFSEKYAVDVLHAISSLKMHPDVNPERIGYWGHSNGGETGLRVAVVSDDIKAFSLWAGVVGSFEDMLETYNDQIPFLRNTNHKLVRENGLPSTNPKFWSKIDPYFYLENISAPIELQHGTGDASVPVELSLSLKEKLEATGKSVEYYEYAGDDHNISQNVNLAWQRTINFFKENL